LVENQPELFHTGIFTVTPEKIRAARVLDALSDKPRSVYSLAVGLRLTTSEVYSALRSLVASGEAERTDEGEFVKVV
jgi:DNA-binding IclR family transcriptional regulator